MKTITLTLENDQALADAERMAAAANLPLSKFIELAIARETARRGLLEDLPPATRALSGFASPISDDEFETMRLERLTRKHS